MEGFIIAVAVLGVVTVILALDVGFVLLGGTQ